MRPGSKAILTCTAWLLGMVASYGSTAYGRVEYVAYSLKAAARLAQENPNNKDLLEVGGIDDLVGVMFGEERDDVVLLGRDDDPSLAFSLDDVGTLLRCAQRGGLGGSGVSLEPRGTGASTSDSLDVVLFGGTAGNSLGKVAFEADYLMKEIALERVPSSVTGLHSYAQQTRDRFRDAENVNWDVLSRFWFVPIYADIVESESGDLMLLPKTWVGVLVETLKAEIDGEPAPWGFRDEAAWNYAGEFTKFYEAIANEHPELRALTRYMGALRLMKVLLERVDPGVLDFWLAEYRPRVVDIPPRVPLIRDVSRQGRRQLTLVGGVRIAALTVRLRRGEVAAVRDAVLLARPAAGSLTWRVALDEDWRVDIPTAGEEDRKIARLFTDGLLEHERGNDSTAVALFEAVLETHPDAVEARLLRAVCARDLAIESGRVDDTLAPLTTLSELARENPLFVEIGYELGSTLRILGRADEAIKELNRVVAARPDYGPAHHALGLAYLSKGDRPSAKRYLKEYLNLSDEVRDEYRRDAKRVLRTLERTDETAAAAPEFAVYSDDRHNFRCPYPRGWKVVGAGEVRELLPHMSEAQNVAVAFMDPMKKDTNVNIRITSVPADALTDKDIMDAIPALDRAYQQRFKGFQKVDAGIVHAGGVKGVRYDLKCDRAGTRMQQCVTTLVKSGKAYTITFTAQEPDFSDAWETFFNHMLSTFGFVPE